MYRTCIYCHAKLGSNEALEAFPLARRVAFDPARGRLWAVCGACERWSLSPVETRWEAIEEAERLYRGTRTRVATAEIGLARVGDGTELVRIGRPLRPEFAAWRYGDRFGRRARRFWTSAGIFGVGAAGAGVAVLNAPLLVLGVPVAMLLGAFVCERTEEPSRRAIHALADEAGEPILASREDVISARMLPGENDWSLHLGLVGIQKTAQSQFFHTQRSVRLTGGAAVRALGAMLPGANSSGGTRAAVQAAVARIEAAGDPERYFRQSELDARRLGRGYRELWEMPAEVRLALEMSAHEDAERRALEGELEILERQWREAEAIAAVADTLAIPATVDRGLERLRGPWQGS